MRVAADTIRARARLTGFFWLGTILTGIVGEVLAHMAFVAQDPAGTSAALSHAQGFVRVSIVANLLTNISYIGVTVLLYEVLRPISRTISRFGLFFGTLGLSTGFVAVMLQIAPLALLGA